MQHQLWLLTMNDELYHAPIGKSPHNVLDLGTGTGIWAIEFANEHPSARVVGSDLSPIQPEFVPPNCYFEISDAEEPWTYTTSFNYIHGRALLSCFKSPASVIAQAYSSLTPGGYLELQDGILPWQSVDNTLEGTSMSHWINSAVDGAAKLGRCWTNSKNYRQYMEEAGFVDIEERHYQWPLGPWPKGKYYKTLGTWFQQDLLEGLRGISMAVFTRGVGMSPEQIEVNLVDVRKDFKNPNIHAYMPVIVIWGRRPE